MNRIFAGNALWWMAVLIVILVPGPALEAAEGSRLFEARLDYLAGSDIHSVAAGDLNRDGLADLVVANADYYSPSLSLLTGRGDGTFLPAETLPASDKPYSVKIEDLNDDGIQDLLYLCGYTLTVRLGLEDGTLAAEMETPITSDAGVMAIGDLDADGDPDVVVLHARYHRVGVLLGYGDGTFEGEVTFALPGYPRSVAIGDVDGDGLPDLVTVVSDNIVSVMRGLGNGFFAEPETYDLGWIYTAEGVAIADLNEDGFPDLAVTRHDEVLLLFGNGDGTFAEPVSIEVDRSIGPAIAIEDLNGDGHADLVIDGYESLYLLGGRGDGTFTGYFKYWTGTWPGNIVVQDLNRDGLLDIVVPCSSSHGDFVSVLLGGERGFPSIAPSYPVWEEPYSIDIGDLTGDGEQDIAVALPDVGSVGLLIGRGDGTFLEYTWIAVGDQPVWAAVSDFDGDGIADLAVAHQSLSEVSVFRGLGGATFKLVTRYPVDPYPASLAAGDFNGDGHPDLAVALYEQDQVLIGVGSGDGRFSFNDHYDTGHHPAEVVAEDLNGDGLPDLLVRCSYSSTSTVFLNDGSGAFPDGQPLNPGFSFHSIALGDLDQDGIPDLALCGSLEVNLLLGNGDGTFVEGVSIGMYDYSQQVEIGDFDEDGLADLVVSHGLAGNLSLHRGLGGGSFEAAVLYGAADYPSMMVVSDFNHDGAPDLAVGNERSRGVSVLLNNRRGSRTVSAALTCAPSAGTLPFDSLLEVTIDNRCSGQSRRIAARLEVELAGGMSFPDWRSGHAFLDPGETYSASWSLHFPLSDALNGLTLLTLEAEDITPAPYNQPPYPPSGDIAREFVAVIGEIP